MRKTLLATSALALAGAMAVGSASAADKMSVGLSGYMQQWVGVADLDAAAPNDGGFAQHSDTEFNVTGKLEADNGLTFSVKIEVEGNSSASPIDESQATVAGEFGKVTLGAEDNAQTLTHVGVGDVGVGLNCGDVGAWIVGVKGCVGGLETTGHQHGDRKAITYFTPRMNGVQLAATYIPDTDASAESGNAEPLNNDNDAWAVGVNATQSFGDTSVKISLGHRSASGNMDPVDLMSGMNDARIMASTKKANDTAIKTYATGLKDGAADLNALAAAAATANASNKGATDIMGAHKADSNTFTNFGLQVGMGAFTFGLAAATRDGGAYEVKRNDIENIVPGHTWDHDGDAKTANKDESADFNDPSNDWAHTTLVEDSSKDYDVVSVGTTYTDGPMAASLSYMVVDYGDGGEAEATMLSFSYTLAPGVASKTSIFGAEQGAAQGTAFVTGITIGF